METFEYNYEISGEKTVRMCGIKLFGGEEFEKTSAKNVKGMCLTYSKRSVSY